MYLLGYLVFSGGVLLAEQIVQINLDSFLCVSFLDETANAQPEGE